MLLLFHDIGLPGWAVAFFFFSILTGPVLAFIGIRELKHIDSQRLVITVLAVAGAAFFIYLFGISAELSLSFFAVMTVPFGSAAAIALTWTGSPTSLTYLIGGILNALAFFGLVSLVLRRTHAIRKT